MVNKEESIILIVFTLLALLIIVPRFWYSNCDGSSAGGNGTVGESNGSNGNRARTENFGTDQRLGVDSAPSSRERSEKACKGATNFDPVEGNDPDFVGQSTLHPRAKTSDMESLIFDNTTGAIMTGSQFMENTGVIAPLWIPPAWDPDAYGPSSKGELDPEDYENDPRMLYNKCSLSCCSPQYPTPFKGDVDPFTCDENGNSKYLSSDYICQNNTGGTGCLCITEKQAEGMRTGFVDYYADPERGWN
jgi:hypothetical protein